VSSAGAPPPRGQREQPGIAAAITEVSERASVLIREEIELAKTEMTEKATRLAKGAVVGVAAGVFFLTALFFVLIGCAWLLYYALPVSTFAYFWGFFAMALILVLLGVLAGFLAARAVKAGAPPMPEMAIEEARRIRETVSASGSAAGGSWAAAGRTGTASPGTASPGTAGGGWTPGSPSGAPGADQPPIPSPGTQSTEPDETKGGYGTAISG